jgi:FMN-dependent NADH-azoreductase
MSKPMRVLRLDASANPGESSSKKLGDGLIRRLQQTGIELELRRRDLTADDRSEIQRQRLAFSDSLIEELKWADHIVLTTPMYNFGVPATLKAWIDQVCRAGITFRYTEDGPEGLLAGKTADIVITTGGAPLESPVDFVSAYLKQVFAFIGISDVNIVGADRMNIDAETSLASAAAQIAQVYPATTERDVA